MAGPNREEAHEVFELLDDGLSPHEIGERVSLGERTVQRIKQCARLADEGIAPSPSEWESIGWSLQLVQRVVGYRLDWTGDSLQGKESESASSGQAVEYSANEAHLASLHGVAQLLFDDLIAIEQTRHPIMFSSSIDEPVIEFSAEYKTQFGQRLLPALEAHLQDASFWRALDEVKSAMEQNVRRAFYDEESDSLSYVHCEAGHVLVTCPSRYSKAKEPGEVCISFVDVGAALYRAFDELGKQLARGVRQGRCSLCPDGI